MKFSLRRRRKDFFVIVVDIFFFSKETLGFGNSKERKEGVDLFFLGCVGKVDGKEKERKIFKK